MVTQPLKHLTDIDRTRPARARRREEFDQLRQLPYRKKEQEGRYVWLKKQFPLDIKAIMKEINDLLEANDAQITPQ